MTLITINLHGLSKEIKLKAAKAFLTHYVETIVIQEENIICDILTDKTQSIRIHLIMNDRMYEYDNGFHIIVGTPPECEQISQMLCAKWKKFIKKEVHIIILTDVDGDKIKKVAFAPELVEFPYFVTRVYTTTHDHAWRPFSQMVDKHLSEFKLIPFKKRSIKIDLLSDVPDLPWDTFGLLTLDDVPTIVEFIKFYNKISFFITKKVTETKHCLYIVYANKDYIALTYDLELYHSEGRPPPAYVIEDLKEHFPTVDDLAKLMSPAQLLERQALTVQKQLPTVEVQPPAKPVAPGTYANPIMPAFILPEWNFNFDIATYELPSTEQQITILKRYIQEHGDEKLRKGIKSIPAKPHYCIHVFIDDTGLYPVIHSLAPNFKAYSYRTYDVVYVAIRDSRNDGYITAHCLGGGGGGGHGEYNNLPALKAICRAYELTRTDWKLSPR